MAVLPRRSRRCPEEDKAIEPAERRALMATPTQQYVHLLTKRYHLCLKRPSRPEEVDHYPLEQVQELEHPEFMARFGGSRQADGICDRDRMRFAVGTTSSAIGTASLAQS